LAVLFYANNIRAKRPRKATETMKPTENEQQDVEIIDAIKRRPIFVSAKESPHVSTEVIARGLAFLAEQRTGNITPKEEAP
jgi:hypothetical protein